MPGQRHSTRGGIVEPDNLVEECCQTIQRAIGINYRITFKCDKDTKGNEVRSLIGHSTARTERVYGVIPIPELSDIWLAASWSFRYSSGIPCLVNASLVIFRGTFTDMEKSVLLRAEWDPPDQSGGWSHAQPHWHIYQAEIDSQGDRGEEFRATTDARLSVVNEAKIDDSKYWSEAPKFHFAMASEWHSNGTHQVALQSQTMISWLSGCLKYVLSELRYLQARAGS